VELLLCDLNSIQVRQTEIKDKRVGMCTLYQLNGLETASRLPNQFHPGVGIDE
jgi:hypothetical protein